MYNNNNEYIVNKQKVIEWNLMMNYIKKEWGENLNQE